MIEPTTMRVLIVDDMQVMCKTMRNMLKTLKFGKSFVIAHNGLDAWKKLQSHEIDLAIVDWNMPVMTGVELIAMIRENKKLRDMPVIMVTAEANREIVAEVAESDVDDYILKPLTIKALEARVLSVIDKANNPSPMNQHLRKGRTLEEAGDLEGAIEELKQSMKAEPTSSRPLRELGTLFLKKNDLKTAEKCLIKAAQMNKLDVFAFHKLGELYIKMNELDKAATFVDKAMQISPRHSTRGLNFGKLLAQRKMYARAMEIFEKTIEYCNDPIEMREQIAEFCLENRMYHYVIKLVEYVIKHKPTRNDLVYKLGLCYKMIGENNRALNYLLESERNDPNNPEIKLLIGELYLAAKKTIRADQMFKSVLKLDPENEKAQELLKECL